MAHAKEDSQRLRELAARAAVDPRTAERWLRGQRLHSIALARALERAARALGIEAPSAPVREAGR